MKDDLKKMDPLSRRQFAAGTAKAALGLSMMPVLDSAMAQAGSAGKAKHLIYIYMGGGMTHIDSFDPKPEAPSEYAGPIGSIGTNVPGIQLGAYFTRMAKMADKLAIVNTLTQKTGAHDGGRYWMLTGYQKRATIVHPEMLAWKQEFHGKDYEGAMPQSFVIGGGALPGSGFFGPSHSPLPIGDPNRGLPNSMSPVEGSREKKRVEALDTFNESFTNKFKTEDVVAYNQYYDNTMEFLQSDELEVFDLSKESPEEREKFGGTGNRMGQSALLAARLIESGVGGVRISGGGCDNHGTIATSFQGPANNLDVAVSALIERLEASGKLDETLIVVGTEFGRTPKINANAGRDHYPRVFSGMMAGGGIQGGQKWGKSDSKGVAVEENPTTPEDYNATIAMALGIPLDKIIFAPSGRPFLIAGHEENPKTKEVIPVGKPITQFFG
ncbi:MAG: hypothetical protein ACI8UO_004794 [Verrucomicrobiales bacterium]|jgi:hypothetical protein